MGKRCVCAGKEGGGGVSSRWEKAWQQWQSRVGKAVGPENGRKVKKVLGEEEGSHAPPHKKE